MGTMGSYYTADCQWHSFAWLSGTQLRTMPPGIAYPPQSKRSRVWQIFQRICLCAYPSNDSHTSHGSCLYQITGNADSTANARFSESSVSHNRRLSNADLKLNEVWKRLNNRSNHR